MALEGVGKAAGAGADLTGKVHVVHFGGADLGDNGAEEVEEGEEAGR